MRLSGIQKLTLLDFPGKSAATVFTPGCDFRCPFCQNVALVLGGEKGFPEYPVADLFSLLAKRHGLLDGVCITGGEPLLQPDLADFCLRIKDAGFAVKLDTNGSFPDRLRSLVEQDALDYVAMDVKNGPTRYAETAGVANLDLGPLRESVSYLLGDAVPYEFRTTVVRELHTVDDLRELANWIQGARAWFLQQYIDSDTVIAGMGAFSSYSDDEMKALIPALSDLVPTVSLRGVD